LPSGAITVTVGGTAKTETTDYTLARSTGVITFNSAPTGAIVATYNFCRIIRFAEDKMSRELFNYQLYNAQMQLIEVL
jgi:hypothetical protein